MNISVKLTETKQTINMVFIGNNIIFDISIDRSKPTQKLSIRFLKLPWNLPKANIGFPTLNENFQFFRSILTFN